MKISLSRAALAGVVGLTLFAAGCTKDTPASRPADRPPVATAAKAPVAVQVAEAKRGTPSNQLFYSGNVQARQQVSIVPKVAGRVTKLAVDVGGVVQAGDVLVALDDGALRAQLAQAEGALVIAQSKLAGLEAGGRPETVAQATAALEVARLKLQDMEAGGRAEQVAQAEASLKTAQARLQQLRDDPTPEQRRAALQSVEGAKVQLHSVNVKKDGDCNPRNPEYLCQSSQAAAIAAAHNVDAAQAQYDALVAPPTPQQLDQAQAAVDAARAQYELAKSPYPPAVVDQARQALKQAEAQLSLAKAPVQEYDLAAARGAVAQAKAAVDLAQLQLAEATIRAPFAGVIAQRMVAEGSMASPTSPLFTLISNGVEVVVNVEEGNLALLKGGLAGMITTGAYPGEQFKGTVVSIAPSVDPKSRTVQVRLIPDDEQGKLRDGMFAQVILVLGAAKESALLVPANAVAHESGETVVYVVKEGKAERRIVTTGAMDGDWIEITAGLAEVEHVAVTNLPSLKDGQEVSLQ